MSDGSAAQRQARGGRGLVLIGGGGHAIVVAEAAVLAGIELAGFVDDDSEASLSSLAITLSRLESIGEPPEGYPWILAIGTIGVRRRLLDGPLALRGEPGPAVIHPQAMVSPSAAIGPGAFVAAGAVINARAHVGAHALINSGAIIEHDVEIGENAHIAPGAVLGGCAVVGDDALVGLGSRVLPQTEIGARAVLGAGAVAVRSVPPGATVKGVPAR